MFSDCDEMGILTRSLQTGCSPEEVCRNLLEARRQFLSQWTWVVGWEPLRSFHWNRTDLKGMGTKVTGVLKASSRGLYFHAYWNCIWGLTVSTGDEQSSWVIILPTETEKAGDLTSPLVSVESRYSTVEEISRIGKISFRTMLGEIRHYASSRVESLERRLAGAREIQKTFDAEELVLRELDRQIEEAKAAETTATLA